MDEMMNNMNLNNDENKENEVIKDADSVNESSEINEAVENTSDTIFSDDKEVNTAETIETAPADNFQGTLNAGAALDEDKVQGTMNADTVQDENAVQGTVNTDAAQVENTVQGSVNADMAQGQNPAQVAPDPYNKYIYPNMNNGYVYYQPGSGYPRINAGYGYPQNGMQGYPQGYPMNQQGMNPQGINQQGMNQSSQAQYPIGYPQTQGNWQNPAFPYIPNQFAQNQTGYGYQGQGEQNFQTDQTQPGTNTESVTDVPVQEKPPKKKSKVGKFFAGVAMAASFGFVAAAAFVVITYLYKKENPEVFEKKPTTVQVSTTESKNRLNLEPANGAVQVPSTNVIEGSTFTGTDVSSVVEKAMPSIVSINCVSRVNSFYGPYDAESAGSGIIIEKKNKELMIATNNHVVDGAKSIKVTFSDGSQAPATVKGKDAIIDVAVISVLLEDLSEDTLKAISVATLGNSDDIKIGEMAIAIGNSLGYGQSVTVGYISAKDRSITIEGQTYTNLLQTDAAINPGNSGGALMNMKGEVIGINNAKIGGTSVEGMGYAIPISRAQNILAEFATRETLATEEQGYLGVYIQTVSEQTALMYSWPVGAYISSLVEGGAAEKAGILVGDIITKVDGTEIKAAEDFIEKIKSIRYGTEITVTLQRIEDGEFKEHEIKAVLDKRPVEESTEK